MTLNHILLPNSFVLHICFLILSICALELDVFLHIYYQGRSSRRFWRIWILFCICFSESHSFQIPYWIFSWEIQTGHKYLLKLSKITKVLTLTWRTELKYSSNGCIVVFSSSYCWSCSWGCQVKTCFTSLWLFVTFCT